MRQPTGWRTSGTGAVTRRRFCRGAGRSLAAGLTLAWAPSAAARLVFPDDGTLAYLVSRNDQVVGERRQSISRASGDLVVRLDQSLAVGPAGRPFYRLEQHVEEVWHDGWLHALVSDTEEDGRLWRVRAERRNGVFGGLANGLDFTVSGYAITSTFWHRDTPTQEALLDVVDARVKLIRGRLVGEETLSRRGRDLATKHYLIHGQLNSHLWYDEDCRLVRLRTPLRDGSEVIYDLA